MEKNKKNNNLITPLTSVLTTLAILSLSFFIYVGIYNHATPHALAYLQNSDKSIVKDTYDYLCFIPKIKNNKKGIIFYPGGKVEYKAYAPLLRSLSDIGITCILAKVPFNLAVLNYNAANNKQKLFPNITSWYIGGHSLGGAMAAKYLEKNYNKFKGLILLGAYSKSNLSLTNLTTLSILASNDKVLNMNKYIKYKCNLPSLTEYVIKGGIHSYFGDYGIQNGDGIPTLDVEKQTKIIVNWIADSIPK